MDTEASWDEVRASLNRVQETMQMLASRCADLAAQVEILTKERQELMEALVRVDQAISDVAHVAVDRLLS